MAITEWHKPIHEIQKGEVTRERCYLEPYYFFNGNLKDYSELLEYAYTKKYLPDIHETSTQYDEFLEKHPICFHSYDVKKGKAPTYQQLREWSSGANTACDEKHKWDDRRTSKRNEISRIADENLAAQITEDLPYFYTSVKKDMEMVDESVDNSKNMGTLTPHQAESATKAKHHIVDSILKLTGKDKDFKLKADIESDTRLNMTGEVTVSSSEDKLKRMQELAERMENMEYD